MIFEEAEMTETIARVKQADAPVVTLSPEGLPKVDELVTEDDTPVDNFPSEKQQRLLTETLYSSWAGPGEGRSFLVAANVGLFGSVREPPLVPDVFLSLDVQVAEDWWAKGRRAYFFWEFGKPPEVVIEIVSNRQGGETGTKVRAYARMRIPYYVIYDPLEQVQKGVLRAHELTPWGVYVETAPELLAGVGLGLTLWHGVYESKEELWLRWRDQDGNLILTGAERAELEHQRAEEAEQRAEEERRRAEEAEQRAEEAEQRAEEERQRAERRAAQLRALGVEPEENET